MFDSSSTLSGSSSQASPLWRFAVPLLALGALTSGAIASGGSHAAAMGIGMDPPTSDASFGPPAEIEDGDDVGSLPSFWGGNDGVWFLGTDPFEVHPEIASQGLLQAPSFAISGPADAVLAAVESGVGNGGYVIEQWLPNGDLQLSFHGEVVVSLDAMLLETGLVQASLVVVDAYAPAQAAVSFQGHWGDPFALAGGSFAIPARTLLGTGHADRGTSVGFGFGAVGPMLDSYQLRFAAQGDRVWVAQGSL